MAYTTNAPSTSGADFASDVIGSVNYPIVKIAHGAAGTASDVDGTSGLPVNIVGQTQALVVSDGGNSLTVDGSVAVTNALIVSDGGNSLTIDGSVAVTNALVVSDGGGSLTIDNSTLTSLAAAINSNRVDVNIAANALTSSTKSDVSSYTSAVDVLTVLGGYDGTNARAIGVDTSRNVKVNIVSQTGALVVSDGGNSLTIDGSVAVTSALEVSDGGGSLTVDNAGTFAVQAASAGDVAHDATDSGNPIKIGARVNTTPSAGTVSDDDRTDLFADADGYQLVRSAAHGDLVSGVASTTSVTDTIVLAAGGASVRQYITDVIIANTSGTDTVVHIKDGSTTKATFPAPANTAAGGCVYQIKSPLKGTANTTWTFSPAADLAVTCTLSGYKSRV